MRALRIQVGQARQPQRGRRIVQWPLLLLLLLSGAALAMVGNGRIVGGALDLPRHSEFIVLFAGFVLFVAAMRGQVRRR